MKIIDLLSESSIELNARAGSKEDLIDRLVDLMDNSQVLVDKDLYKSDVLKREVSSTTGIGEGVAIPHAKSKGVKTPHLAAMTIKEGADFDSLDGELAHLFFMIAVPEKASDDHIVLLQRLSTMLMDADFRNALLGAKNTEEFLKIIEAKEIEKFPDDFEAKDSNSTYDILAITGCPTGIAHTFMAKEALENKAKDLGYTIKVETHGSTGIENALSKEEIDKAKGIIIASDVGVEKSRFNGKRLVETKVSDGINKPKDLINLIIDAKAPVYKSDKRIEIREEKAPSSLGQTIYKHLMNGVSHMLPFVVGGGILIAIAFLLDDYTIDPANFGSNTPIAAIFNKIGGAAFGFMLPILSGFIAMSIADRPGLTVGFVGGFLANEGGAGFLGALIAGFLSGLIIILLRKITKPLPKSMDGLKPILIFPLVGILTIGLIMLLLLNPPLAGLNLAITNFLNNMGSASKIVLGLLLGGMMAIDMGGPINKAAYIFGTASLAEGSSMIMAAVMAGGMVPPLALAISMIIFKNKYTDKERQTIPTNIIMGLSFITEGAIPFAAADPLRVIPASVVGSAISGMLSMIFSCALIAPHGGMWVIGVIDNPLFYILSILVGSIVGALLLGLVKKDANKIR
ncbi:fructose-specific PTS transporter subunit EIIC [Anaerococcus sp. AGMB09787]|uniref:PTS fructose transporter subunit IIABC n=1 Tax=Anaerococcus sp. AGMB09787 TaxID=2922869 RepID=UPI001FB00B07|nr:fructose-specific PTS transporter subunit EIIC [Anaerococcus sp. AGMB09787]